MDEESVATGTRGGLNGVPLKKDIVAKVDD
jgi:hypothetical protein